MTKPPEKVEARNKVFSKNIKYSAVTSAVQVVSTLFTVIILARILEPEEFGILAMASVFTGISNIFVDLGTGLAIIQREKIGRRFLSSIFWFNLALSSFVYVIMYCASPIISNFYGYPMIKEIIRVSSISIIISGTGIVSMSLLKRNLNFRAILIQQIIVLPLSGILAVGMAVFGFGVWSIVAQQLFITMGTTIINSTYARWYPSLYFNSTYIKEIFNYSSYLSLSKISNYFTKNGDLFLVGKYLGAFELGVYSKGYRMLIRPFKLINGIIQPVIFSTLSKYQSETKLLKDAYLLSSQIMAIIYFPILVLSLFWSEPFVMIVLGEKWYRLVSIIPYFSIILVFLSQSAITTLQLKVIGKVKILFYVTIASSIITMVLFIVGLRWGIVGVALCYSISSVIQYFLIILTVKKEIDIRLVYIFKCILPPFIASIVMFISGFIIFSILDGEFIMSRLNSMLIAGSISILFYFPSLWIVLTPHSRNAFKRLI